MFIASNMYQIGYYEKGHPEKCEVEFFCEVSDKAALEYVKKVNASGKFVFELNKQVMAFETMKEWKEKS